MTEFMEWGLDWLQEVKSEELDVEVKIGTALETAVPILATPVASDANSTSNQLQVHMQYRGFVVQRSELVSKNIKIYKGLSIFWDGKQFDIITDGKVIHYDNDNHDRSVVINTVLAGTTNAINKP